MTTLYAKLSSVLLVLFLFVSGILVAGIAVHEMATGREILKFSIWLVAGALVFAFLAGLVIFRSLTQRLRSLAATVEAFEIANSAQAMSGSAAAPVKGDEIERMAAAFTRMSKNLAEQLHQREQSERVRRELLANVSHDLRTPMASLRGYVETILLKDDALTPTERRNYLETAARQCDRLHRLVNDLFELTKLEAREVVAKPEAFVLAELVQDVAQKFRIRAEQQGVQLEPDLGNNLHPVHADIGLIERVFDNLIENALRHTPRGGVIRVILEDGEGNKVRVRVSDTGHGIPAQELPRIFDRFYQADRNQSDRAGGAGLGLAITRHILELHGSPILVESQANQGTTFRFDLPRA